MYIWKKNRLQTKEEEENSSGEKFKILKSGIIARVIINTKYLKNQYEEGGEERI